MAEIGSISVKVKPELDDQFTPPALVIAATRLHEALWRNAAVLQRLPDDVITAYGDLQSALAKHGITF